MRHVALHWQSSLWHHLADAFGSRKHVHFVQPMLFPRVSVKKAKLQDGPATAGNGKSGFPSNGACEPHRVNLQLQAVQTTFPPAHSAKVETSIHHGGLSYARHGH